MQFLNARNYYKCKEFIEKHINLINRYDIKDYSDSIIKNSQGRLGYIIFQTDTKEELEEILELIN